MQIKVKILWIYGNCALADGEEYGEFYLKQDEFERKEVGDTVYIDDWGVFE